VEIVLNMFVALCVGVLYVGGYILAILSLILLVSWIVDGRYNTNLSNAVLDLLKLYLPEKDKKAEKVVCNRCEDSKTVENEDIAGNYCSFCGKKFRKITASAHDIQVERMTNKIVLYSLAAIICYMISTALFFVFAVLSIAYFCFYCLDIQKVQQRFSR
jgi:hypothetical protein